MVGAGFALIHVFEGGLRYLLPLLLMALSLAYSLVGLNKRMDVVKAIKSKFGR